jgi:integrase
MYNHYQKLIAKAGITKDVGLHSLRHTYATLNIDGKTDKLENVSRTLGHSSVKTTYDIYGHLVAGSGRKASERFAEALKQARV